MMSVRVTLGQKMALDFIADQIHGLPTSKVLREVIKQYIATMENDGYFTDYAHRQTLHNSYEPEVRRVWSNRVGYENAS